MRIETKLAILKRVERNHDFVFDYETIMNGQYVVINNWEDIRNAIQVLQEID